MLTRVVGPACRLPDRVLADRSGCAIRSQRLRHPIAEDSSGTAVWGHRTGAFQAQAAPYILTAHDCQPRSP